MTALPPPGDGELPRDDGEAPPEHSESAIEHVEPSPKPGGLKRIGLGAAASGALALLVAIPLYRADSSREPDPASTEAAAAVVAEAIPAPPVQPTAWVDPDTVPRSGPDVTGSVPKSPEAGPAAAAAEATPTSPSAAVPEAPSAGMPGAQEQPTVPRPQLQRGRHPTKHAAGHGSASKNPRKVARANSLPGQARAAQPRVAQARAAQPSATQSPIEFHLAERGN
jgi:hypothetical protein